MKSAIVKAGALVATLFIIACDKGVDANPNVQAAMQQPSPLASIESRQVPVQTQTIEQRPIQNLYKAQGILSAVHDVELFVSSGETVASVSKKAGDVVKKGDVIAKMAAPDLLLQWRAAKVDAEEKARLHGISEELFKKNHIARDRFEQTRIAQENANISLAQVGEKVANLTIKAPFDGTVVYNDLQPNAHSTSFSERAPIRVVDDRILEGSFSIPVLHLSHIATDMPVSLKARAQAKSATVTRVSPVVDQSTGTVLIYFQVDNKDHTFLAGERASLEIPLGDTKERLVLPENSLVFEGNKPYVFVPRDPTKEEVDKDLETVMPDSPKDKENPEAVATAPEQKDKTDQPSKDDLRKQIAQIPRAKKVAVAVDQLPTGEYALKPEQSGEAKDLKPGSPVVVIGLYQLSEAEKLKVLESL